MYATAVPPRRAQRFDLHTDVRFRPTAVQNWNLGQTQNVSATGVLLRSPEPLPVNTPILIELRAPVPLAGAATVPVVCEGRVVRALRPEAMLGTAFLAVAVHSFHVLPTDPPPEPAPNSKPGLREIVHLLTNQLAVIAGTTDLVLSSETLDEQTTTRLRTVRQTAMQAAATVRKLSS